MKTLLTYTGQVSGPSKLKIDYTIPAGTFVVPNGGGDYWLSDFNMIKDADRHDVEHYGFTIPAEYVEVGKIKLETMLHTYKMDTRNNDKDQANAWDELNRRLKTRKDAGHLMESHGGASHYFREQGLVLLDTGSIFSNQWNTSDDSPTMPNTRVFDWAKDAESRIGAPKGVKRGHYLDITPLMVELRDNVVTCGYCGHKESIFDGNTFHVGCLKSSYLKKSDLNLLRLVPVSSEKARPDLTEAEAAKLVPLYVKAQTELQEKVSAEVRAKLVADCEKDIAKATTERDGMLWLLDHGFPVDNVIYHGHTDYFCFGWRSPLDETVVSELLDIISEFPYSYEIKCADGKKLEHK